MTRAERRGVLDAVVLAEVRAALSAGATPSAALVAAIGRPRPAPGGQDDTLRGDDTYPGGGHESGGLGRLVAGLRSGQTLAESAPRVDTGDAGANLLVRALGVAERTGAGSAEAVEQAIAAARDEGDLARLLRTRTVQARGTAVVLTAVPAVAWLLLVAADRGALAFYATAPGALTGGLALALAAIGRWWSRRLVAAAEQAGAAVDPLTPAPPPRDLGRLLALGVPAFLAGGLLAGPVVGIAAAGVVAVVGTRRTRAAPPKSEGPDSGGAAEAVELVRVALTAGLSAPAALAAVAPLAPPAARTALADAARRLRNGWEPETAFADGGLAALGATLAVTERWGAPAAPALLRLAADLRADRRAAVEAAAERTQLSLIFPTTLLTLPAFVLGVVPPLLWTAFAR